MQFGKTIVLAAIFLSNLENATGAETKAGDKQAQLATAAESGELESIGEDIALLKLDDKVYWNRFLQNSGGGDAPSAAPSGAPSAEPTAEDGDDDDDDDDDGKLSYTIYAFRDGDRMVVGDICFWLGGRSSKCFRSLANF